MSGSGPSSALATALDVAGRGWPVVALHSVRGGRCTCKEGAGCASAGKHPRFHTGDLSQGWRSASIEPEVIRRWAARWQGCNFGIALDPAGLAALDIDTLEAHGVDGPAALAQLEDSHAALPRTVATATPNGGRHLIYRRPDGWGPTNADVAAGVELLGAQLLVLPGSVVATGTYRWTESPADIPELPQLPAWVLEAAGQRHASQSAPNVQVAASDAPIRNGMAPSQTPSGKAERARRTYLERSLAGIASDLGRSEAGGGRRHRAMIHAAIRCGQLHSGGYPLSEPEARAGYMAGAAMCGVLSERGGEREAAAAWEWGWSIGLGDPQTPPDNLASQAPTALSGTSGAESQQSEAPTASTRVVCLADVEPMTVRYLWAKRIPRGSLTGCIGDPGVGKSSLAAAIAAAETRGEGLPGEAPREPGRVLILSAEDHLAAVIRPRMDTLGADLHRVHVLDGALSLAEDDGRRMLEDAMREWRPTLVTIDPIQSYLGGRIDMHRANEVRAVLAPLADLAERHDAAVMMIGHLTKATGGKAMYRALGSVDFAAAARSFLLAGADPDDENERAVFHIKCNLGPLAEPIGYSLDSGRFNWKGTTNLTAAAVLAMPDASASRIEDAEDFLRMALADGPRPVKELEVEAESAGLSWATVRNKAKPRTGVRAERQGGAGKDGWWHWRLPAEPGEPAADLDIHRQSAPDERKGADGALRTAGSDLQGAKLSAPPLRLGAAGDGGGNGPRAIWMCRSGHGNTGATCTRCGQSRPAAIVAPNGTRPHR